MAGNRIEHQWVICPSCQGEGASSSYLGAFTSEDWADQDDEFKEHYLRGGFDRACERCDGSGKIDLNGEREVNRADLESDPAWQSERLLRMAESGDFS